MNSSIAGVGEKQAGVTVPCDWRFSLSTDSDANEPDPGKAAGGKAVPARKGLARLLYPDVCICAGDECAGQAGRAAGGQVTAHWQSGSRLLYPYTGYLAEGA